MEITYNEKYKFPWRYDDDDDNDEERKSIQGDYYEWQPATYK